MPRAQTGIAGFVLGLTLAPLGACIQAPPTETPIEDVAEDAEGTPFWEGRGPGELYAVGEVRAFEFRQQGRVVGRTWGRYEGLKDGQHRFSTLIEIPPMQEGDPPVRSAGEILLDAEGRLISGFERSPGAEITFRRDEDVLVLTDGRREQELTLGPEDAFMSFMTTFHEELMLGLRPLVYGEQRWRLVPLSGGTPTDWKGEAREVAGTLQIETSLGETIFFDEEKGRIRRIDVPDDQLEVVALDRLGWPDWTIEGPKKLTYGKPPGATFEIREVDLPGRQGEPELFGELLIPAAAAEGPRPAVVFLTGSNLADRHGFAGPPPVDLGFHAMGDALAEAGYVVIRYDEPGYGDSPEAELSWMRQIEDARRAFRTVLVQPEVDPDRVLVVGHGEGGWRGLLLARERPREIIGVALLGAPARSYREILNARSEASIEALDPKLREEARKQQKRLIESVQTGMGVPPELEPQAQWLREILDVDPRRFLDKLEIPIWVAQGGKDFETDPVLDFQAWARVARKGKHRKLQVASFPDLDHLFKLEPEKTSRPARYLVERPVDAAFLEALVQWCDRTIARKK